MYELLFVLKSRNAYLPVFITYLYCFVLGLLQITMKKTRVSTNWVVGLFLFDLKIHRLFFCFQAQLEQQRTTPTMESLASLWHITNKHAHKIVAKMTKRTWTNARILLCICQMFVRFHLTVRHENLSYV